MNADTMFRLPRDGSRITCVTGDQRQNVVNLERHEDHVRLWSIVVPPRIVKRINDVDVRLWEANRLRELVGFSVDKRGRIIGQAFISTAGLTEDEWEFYVDTVAKACDRLEHVLTGRDVY